MDSGKQMDDWMDDRFIKQINRWLDGWMDVRYN